MNNMILNTRVDTVNYDSTVSIIIDWVNQAGRAPCARPDGGKPLLDSNLSKYICFANVHVTMEAYDNTEFCDVINGADLVTPDGIPLVLGLRALGNHKQSQVCGPDLMPKMLLAAERDHIPVGFYGARPETLTLLIEVLHQQYPNLIIAYTVSPPFRKLTVAEQIDTIQSINSSGVKILFVGLGCPKQERWMAAHKGRINAVMLGVGAAFDFMAGTTQQAPHWIRHNGFEWLFRLVTEPRRLWYRYLKHNPRFVVLFAIQLLHHKFGRN